VTGFAPDAVTVAREDPTGEPATRLIDALSDALARITGASGRASSDPATLRHDDACFAMARDALGNAVGCGGWRPVDDEPGVAEIKRMYASPGTRGVGAAVLAFLEAEALRAGLHELRLETRRVNSRAVAFYERHGYRVIENYGRYAGRDDAVCLGKAIAP
jgi:ribosomal protein S18 acetylase RimI-like enzyme